MRASVDLRAGGCGVSSPNRKKLELQSDQDFRSGHKGDRAARLNTHGCHVGQNPATNFANTLYSFVLQLLGFGAQTRAASEQSEAIPAFHG